MADLPEWLRSLIVLLSDKYLCFCVGPLDAQPLVSARRCYCFSFPTHRLREKGPREGSTIKVMLFKLAFVVVLILKIHLKTHRELTPGQWVWSRLPIQPPVPKAQSSLHIMSPMCTMWVGHVGGEMLSLWPPWAPLSCGPTTALNNTQHKERWEWKRMSSLPLKTSKKSFPIWFWWSTSQCKAHITIWNPHTDQE